MAGVREYLRSRQEGQKKGVVLIIKKESGAINWLSFIGVFLELPWQLL